VASRADIPTWATASCSPRRWCFNYLTLGDLYKYAAYDAILQRHEQGVVRNDRTAAV